MRRHKIAKPISIFRGQKKKKAGCLSSHVPKLCVNPLMGKFNEPTFWIFFQKCAINPGMIHAVAFMFDLRIIKVDI